MNHGRRDESRLYKVDDIFKALPFGIIRVETFGLETLFDNVPVHQDPFHFGRTGVDDEPHKQIIFCKNKENCDKPNVFYRFAARFRPFDASISSATQGTGAST